MGAAPVLLRLSLAYLTVVSSLRSASSSSLPPSSFCPKETDFFLYALQSQCPSSIHPNPPRQVNGDFLDGLFTSNKLTRYVAVMFHASWCPFSRETLPTFETLSSVFPQIEHLMIEQASAMPIVFSRYRIYSLPAILILNQTSRVRYRGARDLTSLVQFYQKSTGINPVGHYIGHHQMIGYLDGEQTAFQLLKSSSLNESVKREPYLVFSIIFLCIRGALLVFPEMLSQLKAFWVSHAPHLNLQVFGETSQILGRALQTIDPRRVWAKLRLSKVRSFHESARSVKVWASSLSSVSLGKTSSGCSM